MNDERGMTLVEVLVAIGLLAFIALAMLQLTTFGLRGFARDQGDLLSLAAQRSAISRISSDTRNAISVGALSTGATLEVVLKSGTIAYGTDAAGDLIRGQIGSAPQVVVRGVGRLTFSVEERPKPDGGSWQIVSINAVAPAGQTLAARVTVRRP